MLRIVRSIALVLVCGGVAVNCAGAQGAQGLEGAQGPPASPIPSAGVLPLQRQDASDNSTAPQASEQGTEAAQRTSEGADDHIETDRDAFTPATRLVGKGLFILESAYSFIDNRGVPETHSFPEMLLRFGLLERLEVRLGWNYEAGGGGNDVSGEQGGDQFELPRITRDSRINYGIKAALTKQNGWLPDSIAIAQAFTPTSGPNTATQVVATGAFGWKLPNRWRLDAAMRYATNSEAGDHFAVWAPSVVLRVPIGERWQVHAEYFGLFAQNRAGKFARNLVSPGMHYLVTPNLELGVRVGWGLNEQSPRFFTNAGFGWRF